MKTQAESGRLSLDPTSRNLAFDSSSARAIGDSEIPRERELDDDLEGHDLPRARPHGHRRRHLRERAVPQEARPPVPRPLPVPQGEDAELQRQPRHGPLPLLRLQGERRRLHVPRAGRGLPFAEAVRALAERAGIPIEEERGAAPSEAERHKKEREALYGAMQMAAAWYEEQLREHPHASFAVDGARAARPRADDDAVQAFRIGYAPAGLGRAGRVPQAAGRLARRRRERGADRPAIERHRVLRPLPAPAHVRGHRRAGPRRRVQRARPRAAARRGRRRGPPRAAAEVHQLAREPRSTSRARRSSGSGRRGTRSGSRSRRSLVEGNFDVVSLHARGVAERRRSARNGLHRRPGQAPPPVRVERDAPLRRRRGRPQGRDRRGEPCDEAGLDAEGRHAPRRRSTPTNSSAWARAPAAAPRPCGTCMAQARGLREYLIDMELDETFNAAELAREVASRVERCAPSSPGRRIRSSRDARGAGRRRTRPARSGTLRPRRVRALKRKFALAVPDRRVDFGPAPVRGAREAPAPGQEERKAIVGAILDFPVLLDDSEVVAELRPARGRLGTDRGSRRQVHARERRVAKSGWTAPNSLRK